MPDEQSAGKTYLVEHYGAGLDVEVLETYASRVQTAAADLEAAGTEVRHLRTTIVPGEQSLLCLLEADSEHAVRAVYSRAAIRLDRISPAIAVDQHAASTADNHKEGT